MFKLGLTGSIGMGKSTTAAMFDAHGCEVWDADAAVHRLYSMGGAAVPAMLDTFPQAVEGGVVSRAVLRDIILADPTDLKKIEQIVHPLVIKDRADFVEAAKSDIVVFDMPLLFETGSDAQMDAVVCVWTTPDVQEQRVMARGTMNAAQFAAIRDKQLPADEKRNRADFVIETDTIEHAAAQVQDVMNSIRQRMSDA